MPICGNNNQWFMAASNGDQKFITQNIQKRSNTYDSRETQRDMHIFNGFAAIHYAAFQGKWEVVQLLLKTELLAVTKAETQFAALGFAPKNDFYSLAAGSNCLMIALMRRQIQVIKVIMDYLKQNQQQQQTFLQQQNELDMTVYLYASICLYDEALQLLKTDFVLSHSMATVIKGDTTPILLAAQFSRIKTLNLLHEQCQDQYMRKTIYQMVLTRDEMNLTTLEIATQKIDLESIGVTQTDKQETITLLEQMIEEAKDFAKQEIAKNDSIWKNILEKYETGVAK